MFYLMLGLGVFLALVIALKIITKDNYLDDKWKGNGKL